MQSTLEIRRMQLEDLHPATYNPRIRLQRGTSEYDKLKRSIETFGLVDPLVWNARSGNLVGGHQRYWIMRDLGIGETDVSVVDLDEPHEKALNLALNKVQGDWDLAKLQEVVGSLDAEMAYIGGFHDGEVDEMVRITEIDMATDFLNLPELGEDGMLASPRASIGAPELKDDHPHRTGEQYFEVSLVFTKAQRETYFEAVQIAKQRGDTDSTMDAVTLIMETFITTAGRDS